MSQPDTKQRILDAAEELFARNGFYATSLRQITQLAEVNLAAVNYHFGSKEELLEAVILRHLGPLNDKRRQGLEHELQLAQQEERRPRPRQIMNALVEPTLQLRAPGSDHLAFVTLVGRLLADTQGVGHEIFVRQMVPMLMQFYQALVEALPEVDPSLLYWRLHFTVGSLSHMMRCHDRHGVVPPGIDPEIEIEALINMLLDFTVAGMEVVP
ncbi:MAG: hypothetical protein C0616_04235 [Desulfuromonas sp.]|nr:MAG: hypothetical protein C0616_04235 [Desulfuromonas sp.]